MPRAKVLLGLLIALTAPLAVRAEDVPTVDVAQMPPATQMVKAAAGAGGVVHLLFQKYGAPFYASCSDDGKDIGPPVSIVSDKIATPGLEFQGWDLGVDERGKVFVVMGNNAWRLKLPQNQWGMYLAVKEPGKGHFEPMVSLNGVPSEGFSIVTGREGRITAAFLQEKLYWKHSTDGGQTFSPDEEIDKAYLPCPCCTTSLAAGHDGTLALLYREATNNQRDMYVVLGKDGKHTRVRVSRTLWKIDACPMTYYAIAPAREGFVLAWPTGGEVYFTRIDSGGKQWEPGEIKVGGKSAMRSSVFALAGVNDTTLVAWKSDKTLHWRIYDSSGKPIGGQQEIPGAGAQAGGVVNAKGRYVLFP